MTSSRPSRREVSERLRAEVPPTSPDDPFVATLAAVAASSGTPVASLSLFRQARALKVAAAAATVAVVMAGGAYATAQLDRDPAAPASDSSGVDDDLAPVDADDYDETGDVNQRDDPSDDVSEDAEQPADDRDDDAPAPAVVDDSDLKPNDGDEQHRVRGTDDQGNDEHTTQGEHAGGDDSDEPTDHSGGDAESDGPSGSDNSGSDDSSSDDSRESDDSSGAPEDGIDGSGSEDSSDAGDYESDTSGSNAEDGADLADS